MIINFACGYINIVVWESFHHVIYLFQAILFYIRVCRFYIRILMFHLQVTEKFTWDHFAISPLDLQIS